MPKECSPRGSVSFLNKARGVIGVVLLAAGVRAGEIVPLWPEGRMPHAQTNVQYAAMTDVLQAPGFNPDDHRLPFLEWYEAPTNANGCCAILISGGSYNWTSDVDLIRQWRAKFTAAGVRCVNLVYRTPRPQGLPIWQSAWEDGQRAVRLVRRDAARHGCDPEKIGTVSMSAGSHLATLLATSSLTPAYAPVDELDETPCHIAWAVTGAIAYALTDGTCPPDAFREDGCADVRLDSLFAFDAKTAPLCMFHGSADPCTPLASTYVYRRLREKGVPAELHLYADRLHAFWGEDGRGERATGYDTWFGRAREFLAQLGFLGPLPPEERLTERFADDGDRARVERCAVWPEGRMPDVRTNQCAPYLEWHFPKTPKTRAVQIVYSGGGYNHNTADGFEVAPFRRYLNAKGMTVVTLTYRTPRPDGLAKHVSAWQDLQRTVRIVRDRAPGLGLDPDRIGIMGSSAGGHLTLMGVASAGTRAYAPIDRLDAVSCHVQWGVAVYPAYAMSGGSDWDGRIGTDADWADCLPEFAFDAGCCPVVFIHGDADTWSAMSSVKTWEKLRRMGIHGDLHTLATRRHCFQAIAAPGTGSHSWMDRVWEFMNHKGYNRP